ncbi:MAG: Ig-like domain-containing protein [Planctomycetota bacterium]
MGKARTVDPGGSLGGGPGRRGTSDRPQSRRVLTLALLAGLGGACQRPGEAVEPAAFAVVRVEPAGALAGEPTTLLLNQEITVRFSHAVDRTSITRDTLCITDAAGRRIDGQLRTGSHSVTFVPRPPLAPSLDDGSFRPGAEVRLEVIGFPRANGVRDLRGRVLDGSVTRRFRAVPAEAKPALLRSSSSPFGFALDQGSLRMATDSHVLRLDFHESPLPSTVTPEAFEVRVFRAGAITPVAVETARLTTRARAYEHLPGWSIELEFAEPPLREPGVFAVKLVDDPAVMLRDPSGAPPRLLTLTEDRQVRISDMVGLPLWVRVYPGERVPLLREDFDLGLTFGAVSPGAVKFECVDGRAVPQVRTEAGAGTLGVFAPRQSMDLAPGQPFDRGDGVLVRASGRSFDFLGVFIPRGVTVRVRGQEAGPLVIRACGSVRIEGTLLLDATPVGHWNESAADPAVDVLLDASGVAILAGGDILIPGQIRHQPAAGGASGGSPLSLIAGGGLMLNGRLPPATILATEPSGRVAGAVQGDPIRVAIAPMRRRVAAGLALETAAVTPWLPLPSGAGEALDVVLGGVRGGLAVEVQAAPADPRQPALPALDLVEAPRRLPLRSPLAVPPAGFVRFFLSARLRPGEALPSLDSITVLAAP